MPNTREIEMLRSAESAVLAALANGQPQRIAAIGESVRAATNNPLFPDAIILTAICNLSDLGKIIQSFSEGILFYSLASASERESAQVTTPPEEPSNG
jgi:hypothetical protein